MELLTIVFVLHFCCLVRKFVVFGGAVIADAAADAAADTAAPLPVSVASIPVSVASIPVSVASIPVSVASSAGTPGVGRA